jgi:hypothetical protein
VTLPAVAAEALAEHLSRHAEVGRTGWCSRSNGAAQSAAATSPAESGSRLPERPGSRGCAFLIYGTPQRP